MLWILGFQLQLQPKGKEVFTYDRVKTGFVLHISGDGGKVRVLALKRREDGLYTMSERLIDLSDVKDVVLFLKPETPIYSSNFPYALTGGEAPEGVVIIYNLQDEPLLLQKVEVETR